MLAVRPRMLYVPATKRASGDNNAQTPYSCIIVQVFTLGLGLEGSPVRLTVVMLSLDFALSLDRPPLARFELSFVGVVEILALALRLGPESPGGGGGAPARSHDLSHGAPLAHGHASAQGDSGTGLCDCGVWRYFRLPV